MNDDFVHVRFWEDEDKPPLLTIAFTVYPAYQVGNTIWLEKNISEGTRYGSTETNPLDLTKYRVVDIHHSVEVDYFQNLTTIIRLDVYVEKAGEDA